VSRNGVLRPCFPHATDLGHYQKLFAHIFGLLENESAQMENDWSVNMGGSPFENRKYRRKSIQTHFSRLSDEWLTSFLL